MGAFIDQKPETNDGLLSPGHIYVIVKLVFILCQLLERRRAMSKNYVHYI
jgi:hypothetical protein